MVILFRWELNDKLVLVKRSIKRESQRFDSPASAQGYFFVRASSEKSCFLPKRLIS